MTSRLALLPLWFLGSTALAAPTLDDTVRQRAEEITHTGLHPSIVIAVIDGKSSAVYGFGSVHADKNAKPGADTVYQIGSVTKTMTALLLADAVVEGKVTLAEPVAALLPGYTMPAFDGKPISLLDLATHYSALPRLPDNFAPKNPANPYADYTEANWASMAWKRPARASVRRRCLPARKTSFSFAPSRRSWSLRATPRAK
ncbi:serine hydrolase [Janthinobacterium sp. LB3P118]|uniref:serine hydrolase n=1 Tax=Janthinobacterium sp. LB3P118 TaxID=3424195 RepID=UPI003F254FAC